MLRSRVSITSVATTAATSLSRRGSNAPAVAPTTPWPNTAPFLFVCSSSRVETTVIQSDARHHPPPFFSLAAPLPESKDETLLALVASGRLCLRSLEAALKDPVRAVHLRRAYFEGSTTVSDRALDSLLDAIGQHRHVSEEPRVARAELSPGAAAFSDPGITNPTLLDDMGEPVLTTP